MKSLGVPAEEVNAILESKRKEVLSGQGLQENEEEAALLQLGIESKPKNGTEFSDSPAGRDEARLIEAAAERVDATKAKSPFVAQVIEDVCPGIANEGEDEVADPVVSDSELISAGSGEGEPSDVVDSEAAAFQ